MAGTSAGYDLSVTTISPDGKVGQVEYAQKATEDKGTALGIVCNDGIVFAVEKFQVSKMLVPGTSKKTFPVHRHAGMTFAGLAPDARQIVLRAREEAKSFKNAYCEEIPPEHLAERLGMYMHAYTVYGSVRPFGCAVLLGVVNPETKERSLFCVDPTGMAYKYKGTAVGKGRQAAKTEIEKVLAKPEGITCKEALHAVAKILHKVHDEKDRDFELEVAWICPESDYEMRAAPDDLLKEAEKKAKDELDAEDE